MNMFSKEQLESLGTAELFKLCKNRKIGYARFGMSIDDFDLLFGYIPSIYRKDMVYSILYNQWDFSYSELNELTVDELKSVARNRGLSVSDSAGHSYLTDIIIDEQNYHILKYSRRFPYKNNEKNSTLHVERKVTFIDPCTNKNITIRREGDNVIFFSAHGPFLEISYSDLRDVVKEFDLS